MPAILSTTCTKCDFKTSPSFGAQMYVKNDHDDRIICPHPEEHYQIAKTLNISPSEALSWLDKTDSELSEEIKLLIESRVGIEYQHVCIDCLNESYLDKKIDELRCKHCGSNNIYYVADLINQLCPKCKMGILKSSSLGIS